MWIESVYKGQRKVESGVKHDTGPFGAVWKRKWDNVRRYFR